MTTTTEHDIQPYATKGGDVAARCLTHNTVTTENWPDTGRAMCGFRCDEGRRDRFITVLDGPGLDAPVMRDLTGLARVVAGDVEARAYGYEDGVTAVWMWHEGGKLERLTIALDHAMPFDSDDYATETWKVTGEDGRVILTVPVLIDGRA